MKEDEAVATAGLERRTLVADVGAGLYDGNLTDRQRWSSGSRQWTASIGGSGGWAGVDFCGGYRRGNIISYLYCRRMAFTTVWIESCLLIYVVMGISMVFAYETII
ncbi:phenylalanine--tRNA ligase beta subunit [Striga asiatica]|uniref:Phenylalanine--tRNA ligase beta subunit n=1 Tax=Striga asiatica TaxID=4170 RepID=A0A5A7QZB0_STRAF|nr:phenylalanine--tRNA ligase beta subunit [Striga asiatica]